MRSPRCKGSQRVAWVLTDPKRAVCPFCDHTIAVRDGKLVSHWWSVTTFKSGKRGRSGA